MRALQKVVRNGNSCQVTIPASVVRHLEWWPHTVVALEVVGEGRLRVARSDEQPRRPAARPWNVSTGHRSIGTLVKNGNSTQVLIPRPMLIALDWLPGAPVVLEVLEDRSILIRLPVSADFLPVHHRVMRLDTQPERVQ